MNDCTSREAAILLMAHLENRGWQIYLDDEGRMNAIIGDPASLPTSTILALLGTFADDVIEVLHGLGRKH
jgi:hypothetical protein